MPVLEHEVYIRLGNTFGGHEDTGRDEWYDCVSGFVLAIAVGC